MHREPIYEVVGVYADNTSHTLRYGNLEHAKHVAKRAISNSLAPSYIDIFLRLGDEYTLLETVSN